MTPAAVAVAVVGPGDASSGQAVVAEEAGRLLAEAGAVVVTGGLGGVMEAASRGASSAGGVTVGLLPGLDRRDANAWVSVALPTGLGELRNGLVVRAADAVLAVGGGFGTLSEIALALKAGKRVAGVASWAVEGVEPHDDAAGAVRALLEAAPAGAAVPRR